MPAPDAGDCVELARDRFGQVRLDCEAVARVGDGRRGDGGERQRTEAPQRGEEAGDLARHGDRQAATQAQLRHRLAVADEHVRGSPRRARPRGSRGRARPR